MSRADAGGKAAPKKRIVPPARQAPPLGSLRGTKATRSSKQTESFQRRLQGLKPSQPTEQGTRKILTPKRRAAKDIRHEIVRQSLKDAGIKKPTYKQVAAVSRHPAIQKDLHKTINKVQRNQEIAKGAASASSALSKKLRFGKDRNIKVSAAGISLPKEVVHAAHAAGATAVNVGKAVVSDPLGQTGKAAKFVGQSALGAGGAVGEAGVAVARDLPLVRLGEKAVGLDKAASAPSHVLKLGKKIGKEEVKHINDYYGELYRNEPGAAKRQLEKLKDEGVGTAVADLAIVGGTAAKLGRKGKIGRLAPKKAQAYSTRERTPTVGASGELKNLKPAGSVTKGARGAAVDVLRGKLSDKRVSRVAQGSLAEGRNATIASLIPGVKQIAQSKAGKRAVAKIVGRVGTFEHASQDPILNANKGLAGHVKKLKPTEQRALAHAAEFGIRSTTPHPHAIIIQRIGEIRKERAALEAKIAKLESKDVLHPSAKQELEHTKLLLTRAEKATELDDLQALASLSDAELRAEHFTPELDKVADEYRDLTERAAIANPGITADQATSAVMTHQGSVVGTVRQRGETKVAYTARINKEIKIAVKAQSRAANELHHAGGSAGVQSLHVDGTEAARKVAERQANPRARNLDEAPRAAAGQSGIDAARQRYDAATQHLAMLREIRAHPDRAEGTPFARTKGESADEFAARVQESAAAQGLEKPSYSPSIADEQTGGPAKPITGAADRGYRSRKGDTNFRLGARDRNVENLLKGPLQTIKTVANWHKDAEILAPVERGGQVYSKLNYIDKNGKRQTVELSAEGMSKHEAERKLTEAGYGDRDSPFVAVQMGHIRDARSTAGLEALATTTSPTRLLKAATEELGGAKRAPTDDWVIMRKGAADERLAQSVSVSSTTRVAEAIQRAQTAPILGLSPTWALYQIPANVATTLLADPSALLRLRKNQKLIKSLTPEERAVFDMWTGGSASGDYLKGSAFQQSHTEINLGKQIADRVLPAIQHGARDPFKLFQFDRWEVHKFRRNLLMNQVRKVAQTADDIKSIGDAATLPRLEDRVKAVIENKPAMERAAAKLNEAMGDFVTMTAAERKALRSNIMFYGYLRYSTRLLLYTLPVKHPLMAGILANLGQVHKDEVEDLIGTGLPGAVGLIPLGNGQKTDFSRANPLANSLVSIASGQSPESLISSMPPFLGATYSVLSGRDPYRNKALTYLDASGSAAKFNDDPNSFHTKERARAFVTMMLKLASPVSLVAKQAARGKLETSDSIPLLSPRYARVGSAETQLNIEKSGKEAGGLKDAIGGFLLPGFPQSLAGIEGASKGKQAASEALTDEVEKRRLRRAMEDKKPGAAVAYRQYLRDVSRKKRDAARTERKELSSEDRARLRELYRKGLK